MISYPQMSIFPTPVHQAWGGTQAKLHWVHLDSSSGALSVCLYQAGGGPLPRRTMSGRLNVRL